MDSSIVLGSAIQLQKLTTDERNKLDQKPWVFMLNDSVAHWRELGIRPTVWVYGDSVREWHVVGDLLYTVEQDDELRERLKTICICTEELRGGNDPEHIRRVVDLSSLEIVRYKRRRSLSQHIGRSLDDPMYHRESTITDVVNLSMVLNPDSGPIRIAGCPVADAHGHWWGPHEDPDVDRVHRGRSFGDWTRDFWMDLIGMRNQGANIVDCNMSHGRDPGMAIPRGYLLDDQSPKLHGKG